MTSVLSVATIEVDSVTVVDLVVSWSPVSDDGGNLEVLYALEYTTDPIYVGPYVFVGQTNATKLLAPALSLGIPVYFRVTPHAKLVGHSSPIGLRFIPAGMISHSLSFI